MDRPLGVSILAILGFIGGAFMLLTGAIFAAMLPTMSLYIHQMPQMASIFIKFGSIIFLVMGLVSLVVSYGLWTGKTWAWWIYIVILVLGLISAILSLPPGITGLIINGVVLYYMTRGHVKRYFGV